MLSCMSAEALVQQAGVRAGIPAAKFEGIRQDILARSHEFLALRISGYIERLGRPVRVTGGGCGPSKVSVFALTIWPEYELAVSEGPGGVPESLEFQRRADRPCAIDWMKQAIGDLLPWSCTASEILAHWGPPISDERWDLRRFVALRDLEGKTHLLTFDLGLFQSS